LARFVVNLHRYPALSSIASTILPSYGRPNRPASPLKLAEAGPVRLNDWEVLRLKIRAQTM
jgi:hypothetical protein